ncbi:MAG: VOC family protein [Euryarchaeota archaeon]|nr:VOC family protein [Euryarchaeota archaeon]MDE1835923.1 VOC family protein [Euryarchaeota archaeon]MDE1880202.1 VOC family protein [Euryarchaeota archaeon]MDE2044399.1 VOC family protein [Thermoplasmata archaeon]
MIALADVAVCVKDARKSAKWWVEKVGFSTHTLEGPEGHAVMVAPPGDRFVVHLCEGFDKVEPGNSGIAFVTDDLEGTVDRMTRAGVEFVEPLKKVDWGGMAKFADPDGNVFWLLGAPRAFIEQATATPPVVPSPPQAATAKGRGKAPRSAS